MLILLGLLLALSPDSTKQSPLTLSEIDKSQIEHAFREYWNISYKTYLGKRAAELDSPPELVSFEIENCTGRPLTEENSFPGCYLTIGVKFENTEIENVSTSSRFVRNKKDGWFNAQRMFGVAPNSTRN